MINQKEAHELQRLRLLYSLSDFQLALSAAAFLYECDSKKKHSKIELRRFRCYETTLITAYTRPFSGSKGAVPRLNLKMTGLELDDSQRTLHDRLIKMRNKVVAHSDADMMRMVSKAHPLELKDDFSFMFLQVVFDEGLIFVGPDLDEVNELLHAIYQAVYAVLLDEAQLSPSLFDIRKDYLNP